ncbi:MAG TPA: hypothetical protein VI757_10415 [Bacteroidia bacterium]|nr:hypothetical protein [Bacteroidia bacterium]
MNSVLTFDTFRKIFAVCIPVLLFFSFTGKKSDAPSKTIILIPYQRTMHLSDADAEIAEHSKIGVRQVRIQMRNSITEKISFALRDNYGVRLLMEIGTAQEKNDLQNFYDSENFLLSKRESVNPLLTADTSQSGQYFGFFKENNKTDYASSYMNVTLSKPILFQTIANDYEADYFLVLTQLEIKTHYDECIDIASRIFRREFRLHYAIFDAGGNQLGGNYASADIGSGVKNIRQVSESVFSDLVRKVSDNVSVLIQ